MFKIKNRKDRITSYFGLLLIAVSLSPSAIAHTSDNKSDYGLPVHRRDGGSRSNGDNCFADSTNRNLIALVPEQAVGINAANSAELFFYIPKNNQKTLEFVLRNQQDELIYEAFLTTEGEGIIKVEIPADIRANLLETNQNYHWYLSMICNLEQRSRDVVVEGWIRNSEVDAAIEQRLNTANFLEQAELYHQQGFWFDALSVLADHHQLEATQPLVRTKWAELLESVGLEDIAAKPFIDSKLIENNESLSY